MIRQDNRSFDLEGVPGLNSSNRLAQQCHALPVSEDFPAVEADQREEEGAARHFDAAIFHN